MTDIRIGAPPLARPAPRRARRPSRVVGAAVAWRPRRPALRGRGCRPRRPRALRPASPPWSLDRLARHHPHAALRPRQRHHPRARRRRRRLRRARLRARARSPAPPPGARSPAPPLLLALDGLDGWAARRQGLVSAFGARFDMEVDALLILALAGARRRPRQGRALGARPRPAALRLRAGRLARCRRSPRRCRPPAAAARSARCRWRCSRCSCAPPRRAAALRRPRGRRLRRARRVLRRSTCAWLLRRGAMTADLRSWAGLARSLVIYRARPWRSPRLARFYRGIVAPGDLAFDIGAHAGNRTRALLRAGARVVALEPQRLFHAFLARDLPPASHAPAARRRARPRAGRRSRSRACTRPSPRSPPASPRAWRRRRASRACAGTPTRRSRSPRSTR